MMKILFFTSLCLVLNVHISKAETQQTSYESPQSKAEIFAHRKNDTTVVVNVSITLKDNWHTYWLNPGEAGLPPTFELSVLPFPSTITELSMPAPERITANNIVTYGYHHTTMLEREIHIPKVSQDTIQIKAKIRYLVCLNQCINEKAELVLSFANQKLSPLSTFSEHTAFTWPTQLSWPTETQITSNEILLTLNPPQPLSTQVTGFFPSRSMPVSFEAPKITHNDVQTQIRIQKSDLTLESPQVLGLIVGKDLATQKSWAFWYQAPWK